MRNNKIIYITQTAVMLALLIVVQLITRSFGQMVTGSIVNLILLISTFIIGIYGGLTIAVFSPILAFLVGIGPAFIQIIPFIAIGNALLVTIAWLTARKTIAGVKAKDIAASVAGLTAVSYGSMSAKEISVSVVGLVTASLAKFLFLWVGIVQFALPFIPGIKAKQAAVIAVAFSWPQLITALIGSMLALIIIPQLKKALKQG